MFDFINDIWQWLSDKVVAFFQFLYSLVLTIFDILKDLFIFIFESIFDLLIYVLSSIDSYFDGLNIAQYLTIPAEAAYFASASGITQATTMIVSALVIRFLLQLIPFTRLGS